MPSHPDCVPKPFLLALDQLVDLGRKVVLALLEAFAAFIGDERNDLDLAAQCLGRVFDIFADFYVIVLDVLLFEQAGGVVKLGNAALDHLRNDRIGLVGALGIILDLGEQDFLLVVDHRLRYLCFADISRRHRRDLHADVLGQLGELGLAN